MSCSLRRSFFLTYIPLFLLFAHLIAQNPYVDPTPSGVLLFDTQARD
jgi:hypothetical protein